LIQDLIDANKEQEYFLGTIVLHKRKDGVNDIVDGQQRLTTTMILLACLRDLIDHRGFKESIQVKIMQKANEVDGIPERIRMEVKDREIFHKYVVTEKGTDIEEDGKEYEDPHWRYRTAIITFRKKLRSLSQDQLKLFVQFLNQNCMLISLSTTTFDDAFRLF